MTTEERRLSGLIWIFFCYWERNYEVFYGAYIHLIHVPLRLASYMVIGKQQLLLM